LNIIDLATIISAFTSLVFIVGLVIEIRNSRLALQTQALLGLEERFYSPELIKMRQIAAKKLLENNSFNPELEDTLDFLHSVIMLVERKVVDKKLAIEFYKYWIARYWIATETYILNVRKTDDPDTYKKFERMARLIIKKNPDINYSPEAMEIFLLKEARIEIIGDEEQSNNPEESSAPIAGYKKVAEE